MQTALGVLIIVAFIGLVIGLVKPKLILPKSIKFTRGKIILLWLALTLLLLIFFGILNSNKPSSEQIEIAKQYIEQERYGMALSRLEKIAVDDSLYSEAQKLIAEAQSLVARKDSLKNMEKREKENESRIKHNMASTNGIFKLVEHWYTSDNTEVFQFSVSKGIVLNSISIISKEGEVVDVETLFIGFGSNDIFFFEGEGIGKRNTGNFTLPDEKITSSVLCFFKSENTFTTEKIKFIVRHESRAFVFNFSTSDWE